MYLALCHTVTSQVCIFHSEKQGDLLIYQWELSVVIIGETSHRFLKKILVCRRGIFCGGYFSCLIGWLRFSNVFQCSNHQPFPQIVNCVDLFLFLFFLSHSLYITLAGLNSLCRPGWPQTQIHEPLPPKCWD